jgi:F0F1-type ATP synthase assembly protein I
MKARELAMVAMYLSAVVCVAIALALKQNYWQADAIGSVGGLAFILGLRIYGPRNEHARDASAGIMASSVHQEPAMRPDDAAGV